MRLVKTPTGKLDKEATGKLFDLIETSRRRDVNYFKNLTLLRDLVAGRHWENLDTSGSASEEEVRVVVNLCHAHVRSLLPTLFFKEPVLDASPTHPRHQGKEQTWEAVVNNTLARIGYAKEIKAATLDAVIFPEGWTKWVVNKVPEQKQTPGRPSKQDDSIAEVEKESVEWLSMDTPACVRVSPIQVIVDYLSPDRNPEGARFIAVRYLKLWDDLKADTARYPGVAKLTAAPQSSPTPTNTSTSTSKKDPFEAWDDDSASMLVSSSDDLVTIWEVWVKQISGLNMYEQMVVLLEGHDEPIRGPVSWSTLLGEGVHEYPFDRIVYNPVPDSTPLSELEVWKDQQVALDWLMSRLTSLVENDRQVIEVDISKLADKNNAMERLRSGSPREYIEVNEAGALANLTSNFVGRDNYTLFNLILQMQQRVAGLNQNRQGGSGIRTATEASIVEDATQIRTSEKVEVQRLFLKDNMRKLAKIIKAMVKAWAGTQWVIRVSGDQGFTGWLTFTDEDLQWIPEIDIRADSFRKKDQADEIQKLMTAWNALLQALQVGQTPANISVLLRQILIQLEVPMVDRIIADDDAEIMHEMANIAALLAGPPASDAVQIFPNENHAARIRMIEGFLNSQMGQLLLNQTPEAVDALQLHLAQRLQLLEAGQQGASQVTAGQNAFDNFGENAPVATPANEARQETQSKRANFQAVPGTGGQL